MNNNVEHIKAWKEIQNAANNKAVDARSNFNSSATWIPIGAGAGLAIVSALSGGVISSVILGAGTLYTMTEAHVLSYREEYFYKALAKHASMTKRLIEIDKLSGFGVIPDFDEEKNKFQQTYKRPSLLKCLFNSRATIIAVTVCASAAALTPKDSMDNLTWFNRKDETTDSTLAPERSIRPVARPSSR